MTLDDVRALLVTWDDPSRGCRDVTELLDEHIVHVEGRIAELKELEGALRELRHQCQLPHSGDACGIIAGLSSPASRLSAPALRMARTPKRPAGR